MRKTHLSLIVMLIAVLSLAAFISCDNTPKIVTHHVTVMNGEEKVKKKDVAGGDTFTLPSAPSDSAHTFAGWLVGDDLKQPGEEITVTEDTTITASWKNRFTVTVISDTNTLTTASVTEGDSYVLPAMPVDTRTFMGWEIHYSSYGIDIFDTILQPGEELIITDDTMIVAGWKVNYTVSFDLGYNTEPLKIENQTVEYFDTATEPTWPERTGYYFDGWLLDGKEFDFNTKITSDITLKASWVTVPYMVNFDLGYEADVSVSSQWVKYKETAEEPSEPAREGYTFLGWYYNEEKYDFASTPVTSDITLRAHWNITTCTVSFNTCGGSTIPSRKIPYGETVTYAEELPNPTKIGEEFAYWIYDSGIFDLNTPIKEDIELLARWNEISYTVTFDLGYETDDKINIQPVYYGGEASEPAARTRKGYVFSCWKVKGGGVFDFSNPVTSNLDLVAVWTPITLYLNVYFPKDAVDVDIIRISIGDEYEKNIAYDSGVAEGDYLKYTLDVSGVLDHGTYDIELKTFRTDGTGETQTGSTYSDSVKMKYNETDKEIKIDVSEFDAYSVKVDFKASSISGDNTTGYVIEGKTTITYDSSNLKILYSTDGSEPALEYVSGTEIDTTRYTADETKNTVVSVRASAIDTSKWTKVTVTQSSTILGALGPAGGVIFYDCDADNGNKYSDDKESSTCGWKYLEASPKDLGTYPAGIQSGNSYGGTDMSIGSGKENTEKLKGISGSAAEACVKYSVTAADGTVYADWFLPSRFELGSLLSQYKLFSNLSGDFYWSSTVGSNGYATCGKKSNNGNTESHAGGNKYIVRAVRRF